MRLQVCVVLATTSFQLSEDESLLVKALKWTKLTVYDMSDFCIVCCRSVVVYSSLSGCRVWYQLLVEIQFLPTVAC